MGMEIIWKHNYHVHGPMNYTQHKYPNFFSEREAGILMREYQKDKVK